MLKLNFHVPCLGKKSFKFNFAKSSKFEKYFCENRGEEISGKVSNHSHTIPTENSSVLESIRLCRRLVKWAVQVVCILA